MNILIKYPKLLVSIAFLSLLTQCMFFLHVVLIGLSVSELLSTYITRILQSARMCTANMSIQIMFAEEPLSTVSTRESKLSIVQVHVQ